MTESSNAKIVSRVQALLAKAESTTYPEEAEALVAKAQELMARHAIDEAVARGRRHASERPEVRHIDIEAPYASAKTTLLTAIGHSNFVQVVFSGVGRATLVGFATDLDVVEMLFASLLVQATAAMLRVPRAEVGRHVRAFRHAFLIAYARRIALRLKEARAAAQADAEAELGMALVPLFDARRAAVDERVNEEFPYLRSKQTSVSHYGGYAAGTVAAASADIGNSGSLNGNNRALRAEARRIALAAQGFAKARPKGKVTAKHLLGVVDTLGGVQVDTVNVMARAHLMTFFSRVGPYDEQILHKLWQPGGGLVEYWMHGTSLMRYDTWPLFAWRMRADRRSHVVDAKGDEIRKALAALQREVDLRGEVTASELEVRTKPKEPWWDWTATKARLEFLVRAGSITTGRKPNFERTYLSLFESIPDDIVAARDAIDTEAARRASVLLAARALGVARQKELTYYVLMQAVQIRSVIKELVADGELVVAQVEGLKGPWYLHPDATKPRAVNAAALVNPFDPMMWRRERVEDLFGFDYVLEIFVPEPKRVFGYYVMPFLLGEQFVARVDLKADRKAKALLVQASYAEFGVDLDEVIPALAHELREVARWQGLDEVVVKEKGDLAKQLAAAF